MVASVEECQTGIRESDWIMRGILRVRIRTPLPQRCIGREGAGRLFTDAILKVRNTDLAAGEG